MARRLKRTTRHRHGKRVVEVERLLHPEHVDAGYHLIEWGEHSHPKHELLGEHETPNGRVLVEHVEGRAKFAKRESDGARVMVEGSATDGPEFKLTYEDGSSLTVLCADTVRAYLEGSA
jgi:hypothetical protein